MTKRTVRWQTKLRRLGACPEAVRWAAKYKTFGAAWRACDDFSWLVWLGDRLVETGDDHTESACAVCLADDAGWRFRRDRKAGAEAARKHLTKPVMAAWRKL